MIDHDKTILIITLTRVSLGESGTCHTEDASGHTCLRRYHATPMVDYSLTLDTSLKTVYITATVVEQIHQLG